MTPDKTGARQDAAPRGRFRKGTSGNPAGRPVGSRNAATQAVERLLEGEAEAITRKAIDAALAGDMIAIRLVMDRIAPPRKDRLVMADLPDVNNAADAQALCLTLLQATLQGKLTPDESAKLAGLVEVYSKLADVAEFERRLDEIERRAASMSA